MQEIAELLEIARKNMGQIYSAPQGDNARAELMEKMREVTALYTESQHLLQKANS